jgi:hypothetical protein
MRSSSSTARLVVSGMSEVEAGLLLSRLHHMQKVGILSQDVSVTHYKEVEVARTDTSAADESFRLSTYGGL